MTVANVFKKELECLHYVPDTPCVLKPVPTCLVTLEISKVCFKFEIEKGLMQVSFESVVLFVVSFRKLVYLFRNTDN